MILLIYLLKVSGCQTVFYLFYRSIVRHDTHFNLNRIFLISSIPLSFLLPYLPQLVQSVNPVTPVYIAPISELIYQAEVQATVISQNESHFSSFMFIKILYGIVCSLLLFRFIKGIGKIYSINRHSDIDDHGSFRLAWTKQKLSPFSFLNTIYLSKGQSRTTAINQNVLNHELAHVHGRHSYDMILVELVKIITWFNPVIYLIKNELKRTHEYIADQAVIDTGQLAKYYQQLITQSISNSNLSLALPFSQSNIKNRINMMNKKRSAAWKKYKYVLVIPMVGLIFSAFSLKKNSDSASMLISIDQTVVDSVPVYKMVDEMPRFPGCEDILDVKEKANCASQELLTFIYSNIQYPEQARKKGIEGQTVISFIIEKDGSITSEKVLRDLGGGLGEESLRLVQLMNQMPQKWTPGKDNGKIVRVQYRLPIKYKLEGSIETSDESLSKEPSYINNKGKVMEAEFSNMDGTKYDEVYKIIEEMPRFPGCEDMDGDRKEKDKCSVEKLLAYVGSELKYPALARKSGVQGQVVISFIVEKNGTISDATILKDQGSGLGEEALRVVKSMNHMPEKWRPGHHRGVAVRTEYQLPVKFKLDRDTKEVDGSDAQHKLSPPPPTKSETSSEIFKIVEQMPRFPGCEDVKGDNRAKENCATRRMLEYVYSKIKYPALARENGVQGQVVVSFIVEKNGDISDIKILRDKGAGLGEEAARVIRSMNQMPQKWTPGRQRGKAVRVQYNLPVKFKLEGPIVEKTYTDVDQKPRFPGCEDLSGDIMAKEKCASAKMIDYLSSQIVYPKLALQEKIEGSVVVTFIVKKDGSIADIKVLRDIGGGLAEESIRIINSMNHMSEKWIPGYQQGLPVHVQYYLPLQYKLPLKK